MRIELIAALVFAVVPVAHSAEHPNVVFILTDDMGYGDLGCYGSTQIPTPNLDKFAASGTRLTQFYVASPICSPSRTAFTTGMFPGRWRINSYLQARAGNKACEQADWLDPKAPTLARTLKAAGYATGHFGKWHMGGGRDVQDAPLPSAYGYDEHHVNCEGMGPRFETFGAREPVTADGKSYFRHQITEYWVDRTIDFMRRHKGGPFYVDLWPQDVHDPHTPSQAALKRIENAPSPPQKNFRAVLDEFDKQIGRLIAAIHDLGLDDNTIVVFSSDNGPQPSFEHLRSLGLRGQKWSLYEGGIREPYIIRWPGHVPAGKVNEATVMGAVDQFPTICRLCGIAPPANAAFDGEDLSAALLGQTPARTKPLFWEYGRNSDKAYPYPREESDKSPNVAIRDGHWKLLVNADGTNTQLYDVVGDSNEVTNVAAKHPDIVKKLTDRALAWRKSLP
jgi:arylsulfatase A-like enzyme